MRSQGKTMRSPAAQNNLRFRDHGVKDAAGTFRRVPKFSPGSGCSVGEADGPRLAGALRSE